MTIKTPGRNAQEQPDIGPAQQDLQAAYQVHTLAHMLYGQLVATYPWTQFQHPSMAPTPIGAAAAGFQTGPTMPWTQTQVYGYHPTGPMGQLGYPWAGYGFYGSQFIPR